MAAAGRGRHTDLSQQLPSLFVARIYCQIIMNSWLAGPQLLLIKGARYLGKLHALLKDYPMESSMDYEWAKGFRGSDKALTMPLGQTLH